MPRPRPGHCDAQKEMPRPRPGHFLYLASADEFSRPLPGEFIAQAISATHWPHKLLERNGCAGFLQLSNCLVGSFLVDAFENRLRCTIDERLRLTEAEAGDRTHLLDDLDLLLAGGLENNVERRLLFDLFSGSGGASGTGNGDGSRSGDLGRPLRTSLRTR